MLARVLVVAQEPACDKGSCRKTNHRASTKFPRRSIPMKPPGSDGYLERKGSSHNAHKNATRRYMQNYALLTNPLLKAFNHSVSLS